MLFGRRWLQGAIDDLAEIIPSTQIDALCDRLNSRDIDALHAQWETAIVWASSQTAKIVYEPELGGPRHPDLMIKRETDIETEVVVDITSISNEGFEKKNPIDRFIAELDRLVKANSIVNRGFNIEIKNRFDNSSGHEEIALAIPHPREYHTFFGEEFQKFIKAARLQKSCVYEVDTDRIKIKMAYEPNNPFSQVRYDHRGPTPHLTKNSLYKRLKNKRDQLANSGYSGLMGIIACDSGAPIFGHRQHHHSITLEAVVRKFLQQTRTVAFVVTFSPKRHPDRSLVETFKTGPEVCVFIQDWINREQQVAIRELFDDIGKQLPVPQVDAQNALAWQRRHDGKGTQFYHLSGGFRRRGEKCYTRAQVPARALTDLLSGAIDYETFSLRAGISSIPNFFAIEPTDAITGVRLIRTDKDDDWIELLFEGPDPAVSDIQPHSTGSSQAPREDV